MIPKRPYKYQSSLTPLIVTPLISLIFDFNLGYIPFAYKPFCFGLPDIEGLCIVV